MTKENPKLPSLLKHSIPRAQRVEALVDLMKAHIEQGLPINLSIPPHIETTEALHRLVYSEPFLPVDKIKLKVEYQDGSHGVPFPVCDLFKPAKGWHFQPVPQRHLHLGTLSLRHVVEYDRFVDLYLLRDKETRYLTQGKIETRAYEAMREILNAPIVQQEFSLTIFQAGLEPVAVGLYRALTDHFVERIDTDDEIHPIRICPVYRFGKDGSWDCGSIWGIGFENEK